MRAWKKEKDLEEKTRQELEAATAKITLDHSFSSRPTSEVDFQDMNFDFSQDLPEMKIELER
jgi:hypothetical protein